METESSLADAVATGTTRTGAPAVVARTDGAPAATSTAQLVWNVSWLPAALVLAPSLLLFVVYATQHSWLCDDAYISFRYARNLALGHGLVFNIGERVEGYTNFLWVLELASVWKLFGVRPEHSSYVLSAAYTAGTLLVTALLALRTPFARQRLAALACALFLLAINRSFAIWTSGGLETRQFTFFVILAIWLLQREAPSSSFRTYAPASLAWAAAELTRPEGLLLFGCAGLWMLGGSARAGRLRLLDWAGFVIPFAVVVAAHYGFRYAYYNELLPNTYYAKDVRAWPEAGFRYLVEAVIENGLYAIVPFAALGLLARIAMAGDALHVLSAVCITLHAAYLVRIGGDYFEFRPLDFYWPLLSVAVADGLLLLRAAAERWLTPKTPTHAAAGSWFLVGAAATLLIAYSTVLQLAHLTLTHDLRGTETHGLSAEITEQSFPAAFVLPGMHALTDSYNAAVAFTSKHRVSVRFQEHREFWQNAMNLYGAYIGKTDNLFPTSAVMKFDAVGVVPYSLPDLTVIDTFGLTDRTVAHNPVTRHNQERSLAHDRSPPPGYLAQRGVNLEVLAADKQFGPASEYALRVEDQLWMPLRSPNPAWLRSAFAARGLWWKHLDPVLYANRIWVAGKALQPVRALGFFDTPGNDGWTVTGSGMFAQPGVTTPRLTVTPWGFVGDGLLDSFDALRMDDGESSALSPLFTPAAGDQLVFLVGGGSGPDVGVELKVSDAVVETWRGRDSEALGFVSFDLTPYAGMPCQIHAYDSATGPWGHILADHFMLVH
jgi:hypothetical protein